MVITLLATDRYLIVELPSDFAETEEAFLYADIFPKDELEKAVGKAFSLPKICNSC